jgi:hypothetical protein
MVILCNYLNRNLNISLILLGYHGGEGLLFIGGSPPAQYGSSFGKGDVIGVGVDMSTGELFFTRNGASVGTLYFSSSLTTYYSPSYNAIEGVASIVELHSVYFPTVGTDAKSTLKFNFDGPFAFKSNYLFPSPPFIPSDNLGQNY